MALLENWQKVAYNEKTNKQELQKFWQRYFLLEKGVYEKLLATIIDNFLPLWHPIISKTLFNCIKLLSTHCYS